MRMHTRFYLLCTKRQDSIIHVCTMTVSVTDIHFTLVSVLIDKHDDIVLS